MKNTNRQFSRYLDEQNKDKNQYTIGYLLKQAIIHSQEVQTQLNPRFTVVGFNLFLCNGNWEENNSRDCRVIIDDAFCSSRFEFPISGWGPSTMVR